MKQFSNIYIFIFSAVMVIIVAVLLSFVSQQLKPLQNRNEETEQMRNILASVNIPASAGNAGVLFERYITESFVINPDGERIDNRKPFEVDLKKQTSMIEDINSLEEKLTVPKASPFKKMISGQADRGKADTGPVLSEISGIRESLELPVYICQKENKKYYVFALRGKGLWGPIWGYISLNDDFNTVYGAYFDHKTETPGLGAEINTSVFRQQFRNKTIYDKNNRFVSIEVLKGGASGSNPHGVDAISGGTITSKGVEKMLHDWLSRYNTFIANQKKRP
ncbi:MAG: NADH:ubiquinone reductase (Na(+)-transporting) subunit C [Bacteroidales bacterium]|nr:NADH:ubiquinone reductase (Na(+)-transporting) subunit C [Bacteroidales bacterium]